MKEGKKARRKEYKNEGQMEVSDCRRKKGTKTREKERKMELNQGNMKLNKSPSESVSSALPH